MAYTWSFSNGIIVPKTSGTGIKVDTEAPTFGWRDLEGTIEFREIGVGTPALATFRGNIRGPSFTTGDDYDLMYHLPHDYAPGSDLYIHVHWAHNGTSISGSLVLNYYITYAKGHAQAIFPAEVNLTQTISTPDVATIPQYSHRLDEIQLSAASPSASQLDTDNIEPDGIIWAHFDATTIPTIGGGVPRPFIRHIDIHYQSTSVGTKQKAPNFYV